MRGFFQIGLIMAIILASGCTQQVGPGTSMIACLDYAELEDNFNGSNLVIAEYNYIPVLIMSSPFELSDYQVDNKLIKANSCDTNITLVLVSKDYIEEKSPGTPAEGKILEEGKTIPPSYGWIEGLIESPGTSAKAIRLGFKNIYKCRSDKHKELYNLEFDNEIKMTIVGHENENWYCIAVNSPSLI